MTARQRHYNREVEPNVKMTPSKGKPPQRITL